jgi:LPS O-antigen subunit length determinant protein (WzzB/FepE family)
MHEEQTDEIELIDIIRVLWKRKKLIIFITFLFALVSVGVSLILPKVYVVATIIEPGVRPIADVNGQIVDEVPVVSPDSLRETISGGAYDGQIQKKLNITGEDFPEIKASIPKNTTLVNVSIESSNPDRALAVLNELVGQVGTDIQGKLENEKKNIENEIALEKIKNQAVTEKIALVKNQVSETTIKIQQLEKERQKSMAARSEDAMSVLLYSNEIQNQQIYLNSLQEKLKDLETETLTSAIKIENLHLKLNMVKSTRLVKPPTIPEKPIKPKKPLIVALAGVLGLMGSMMLAFLLEYLERSGGVRLREEN